MPFLIQQQPSSISQAIQDLPQIISDMNKKKYDEKNKLFDNILRQSKHMSEEGKHTLINSAMFQELAGSLGYDPKNIIETDPVKGALQTPEYIQETMATSKLTADLANQQNQQLLAIGKANLEGGYANIETATVVGKEFVANNPGASFKITSAGNRHKLDLSQLSKAEVANLTKPYPNQPKEKEDRTNYGAEDAKEIANLNASNSMGISPNGYDKLQNYIRVFRNSQSPENQARLNYYDTVNQSTNIMNLRGALAKSKLNSDEIKYINEACMIQYGEPFNTAIAPAKTLSKSATVQAIKEAGVQIAPIAKITGEIADEGLAGVIKTVTNPIRALEDTANTILNLNKQIGDAIDASTAKIGRQVKKSIKKADTKKKNIPSMRELQKGNK